MGTTQTLLQISESFSAPFQKKFSFILDFLNSALTVQDKIGLEVIDLDKLSDIEQKRVKAFLFFTTSANTTEIGILRLISGNLFSDAYALLRILYETASVMHFGSQSGENSEEVYRTFFKSNLPDNEHSRGEWKLIKKAEVGIENENPGLIKLRDFMNNFGSHISRSKIVIGNVIAFGDQSASTTFFDSSNRKEFIMALELLCILSVLIIENYDKHSISFTGASPTVADDIKVLNQLIVSEVRPKLQSIK